MLRKIIIGSVLLVVGLVLLLSPNLKVEGTYVFINEGKCHFLAFPQDTLTLFEDGRVESRNFPIDAVFMRRKSLFKDEIKISSKKENQYSILLVKSNIFSGTKLIVCLDQKGYYQME